MIRKSVSQSSSQVLQISLPIKNVLMILSLDKCILYGFHAKVVTLKTFYDKLNLPRSLIWLLSHKRYTFLFSSWNCHEMLRRYICGWVVIATNRKYHSAWNKAVMHPYMSKFTFDANNKLFHSKNAFGYFMSLTHFAI